VNTSGQSKDQFAEVGDDDRDLGITSYYFIAIQSKGFEAKQTHDK